MKNRWTRSHRVFHLRCMCTTPSVASGKQSLYNKGQRSKYEREVKEVLLNRK